MEASSDMEVSAYACDTIQLRIVSIPEWRKSQPSEWVGGLICTNQYDGATQKILGLKPLSLKTMPICISPRVKSGPFVSLHFKLLFYDWHPICANH